MVLTFNEREKEILVDVLEAHLDTLDYRIAYGDTDPLEEREAAKVLLDKIQEA